MSFVPPGENVVQTKACVVSGQEFHITDADLAFYDKISPVFEGKKYAIPSPTLCPDERARRRWTWRNDRNFYNRTCDATGKKIISSYSTEYPCPLYVNTYWWGDEWSPFDYGMPVDFDRPFFDQFSDLHRRVPQIPMINDNDVGSENCEYTYDFARGKDCYLSIGNWDIRDVLYSILCDHSDKMVDCMCCVSSRLCYECIYSKKLSSCAFVETSMNCSDCWFGVDLIGCRDCFFCAGLRQKQYYIFNKPHSKEEYERKVSELRTGSYTQLEKLKKLWDDFIRDFPRRPWFQFQTQNCSGDMIFHCDNVHECHCIPNARDCKFIIRGDAPENCYDLFQSGECHWCYDSLTSDNSWNACFTTWCWKSKYMWYSDNCHSSHDLFGCIALKHQSHCVFNTSYSKQEYEEICAKLVEHMRSTGEWGDFFPIEKSPFAYNDSVADDYFPENEDVVRTNGWKWADHHHEHVRATADVPDDIADVGLDILDATLSCEQTGRGYRVQKNELGIYKTLRIPVPRVHHDIRRSTRLARRNSHKIYERTCQKCAQEVLTVYAPERHERMYCESCYRGEIC